MEKNHGTIFKNVFVILLYKLGTMICLKEGKHVPSVKKEAIRDKFRSCKKFRDFFFSLTKWDFGRKIRISLLIFLYRQKVFFFDFQNVTVSLWVEWRSMISIRESEKSSSIRKDTRCGKFFCWTKISTFFVFSLKIDIIRWPFGSPSKNENPTKRKND